MSIKSKLKHWYTKPRKGGMFDFMQWVLTEPKAFRVTMVMGYFSGTFIFGGMTILGFVYNFYGIVKVLNGVMFLSSLYNIKKYYKNRKLWRETDMCIYDVVIGGKIK